MNTLQSRLPAFALTAVLATASASAITFDDIQLWAGSGSNQAALVIDWNDGHQPESLVWGFRWEGTATGLDMFTAVVAADPRLYAHLGDFSWGTATLGIGYDLNAVGGFGASPSIPFDPDGFAFSTDSADADDARTATDPGDHYVEGWSSGFWAYYVKASDSEEWASPASGSAERTLANGAWDGYSFAPDFDGPVPGEPVAAVVPEPAPRLLMLAGAAALLCARRIRR